MSMKFTRYLEDTQIPEWKRAYIDYRLFKERLQTIRQTQNGSHYPATGGDGYYYSNSNLGHHGSRSMLSVIKSESGEGSSGESSLNLPMERGPGRDLSFVHMPSTSVHPQHSPRLRVDGPSSRPLAPERRPSIHRTLTAQSTNAPPSPVGLSPLPPPALTPPSLPLPAAGNVPRNPKITLPQLIVRQATAGSNRAPGPVPPSPGVQTVHTGTRLARINSNALSRQWTNTSQARAPISPGAVPPSPASRLFRNAAHMLDPLRKHPYATLSLHALVPLLSPQELGFFMALDEEIAKVETFYGDRQKVMKVRSRDLERQLQELDAHRRLFDATHAEPTSSWTNVLSPLDAIGAWLNLPLVANSKPRSGRDTLDNDNGKAQQEYLERVRMEGRLNPEKYHTSKRKLKKAILEHYRAVGMLNNYRILNIYAIQRVLAKFEKTTKIPAERAYMAEKVEPTLFYSDDSLRGMMEELGNVFAAGFEQGNKKKATTRLRAGIQNKSHHNSTFSSGLALGSAFAALGAGIVHVASKSTQHAIAGWDGLLFIYGVLAVPVIFALLVGFNVLVWTRTRINFAFIMEHDIRTRLDPREYWQLPSVLFAALCYAFFLSFARIGSPTVSPTIWPLIWLAFMAVVMFDPLPILFKPARFWLLKNTAKQFKSGFKRVEFTDFWLGDQFCSLSFPLSNIPLIICVYAYGFTPEWRKCGNASSLWPLNFILAILPFLVRLVQSFKRYADSGVRAHLTNAGKYGAGCLAQFWYIFWRHRGSRYDWTLAVWCLCNVFATSYALTWDFLMDWSILRRHCRHWMLRTELIYANHIPLYYFAIVSNTILRFLWILYIPARGPDPMLRSFVLGVLEIVRRFQWNFYRLENEQIGNADQYRAHRDVPLPYEIRQDAEDDDAALEKEM